MLLLNCFFATLCSKLADRKAKPIPEPVEYKNSVIPAGYDVVAFRVPALGEMFRNN